MAEAWTEERLRELISGGASESASLEFKRSASLEASEPRRDEISKDVSAFANSDGGTLIYGILEDQEHVAAGFDAGVGEDDRMRLEQVIRGRIKQIIDGIIIEQVAVADHGSSIRVLVVTIPRSPRAPHQASDKRFYKRVNFGVEPMEEYEIRDVMNRRTGPSLEVFWTFEDGTLDPHEVTFPTAGKPSAPVFLRPQILNQSIEPVDTFVVQLLIDRELQGVAVPGFLKGPDAPLFNSREFRELWAQHGEGKPEPGYLVFETTRTPQTSLPLMHGLSLPLTEPPVRLCLPSPNADRSFYALVAGIYAPHAAGRKTVTTITLRPDSRAVLEGPRPFLVGE